MFLKNNILLFSVYIIFLLIIYLLIKNYIIYPTIIPMTINGGASLFADWTAILNANACHEKGYDVFLENPCDHWKRIHIYGKVLLYLPFIKNFPKFYFLFIPIIMNLFFMYVIVSSLYKYQYKKKFFVFFFLIISVPVLLAVERANIDIVIYFFMFLIAKYNNYIFRYLLVILSTLMKFYPICLSIIFLFGKNLKKTFINLFIVFILIFGIFLFQLDSLTKIFDNQAEGSASQFGVYEFSFLGFLNLLRFLNINIYGTNYNWIKYIYVIFVILFPIILTYLSLSKKIYFKDLSKNLFSNDIFENRLYVLSSTVILICYFFFSNFIYREIFLLGLLPWILLNEKKFENNNFLTFYFYTLSFKFILSSILVIASANTEISKLLLITLKHTIDLYLMSLIAYIFILSIFSFLKKSFDETNT